MKCKADSLELIGSLWWVLICCYWVFIQIAETFLVFVEGKIQVSGFKGLVAVLLKFICYLDEICPFEILGTLLIFREIFVRVAGGIYSLLKGDSGVVAGQLTTIYPSLVGLARTGTTRRTCDDDLKNWFIILSLKVLNLPNDAFAAEHLSKYHVLAIKVWCRYGGDEELGTICA